MKLCEIDFGFVHQASGATNFYGHGRGRGHGWWYHRLLHLFGLNWNNSTVVTKTTTLHARLGNMPLKEDGLTPKEWVPRCIIVDRKNKAVLNAVSLSGPGLAALIAWGEWEKITSPFFISVMSLAPTASERLGELESIFHTLSLMKKSGTFRADWGVQANFSCPNGGVDPNALIEEVAPTLDSAAKYLPDTI